MRTDRVITEIFWEPSQGFDPRAECVFSDASKIRLDPRDFRIKLRLQDSFRYPTDANLSVRTRIYRPEAVRQLLMLEVKATLPEGTAVKLRLFDGTTERFWNGAIWAAAGSGDWNTEAEVNAHLASFDVSARRFAVVLNLSSTDDRVTPEVESVLVLWQGAIDWVRDLVLDSLTAMFKEELEFTTELALPPLPAAASSLPLASYELEGFPEVAGIDAVFDHAGDPRHVVDFFSSYDPATRVVSLSAAIPAAGVPYLRLRARPVVALDTQQDFTEVGRLPQFMLRDLRDMNSCSYPLHAKAGIVRRDTGAAVSIPPPYRATYEVRAEVRTDRSREQMALHEELLRLFEAGPSGEAGPFLRSRATDRRYQLRLTEPLMPVPEVNTPDLRVFGLAFRVEDAALHLKPAVDAFAVKALKTGFAVVPSDLEQAALAEGAPVPHHPTETVET